MPTTQIIPADEILKQLGGRQFLVITGSKNVYSCDKGQSLVMHLSRNRSGAMYLKITLTVNDTYTMVFSKTVGKKHEERLVVVSTHENVYNDMLQTTFTDVTGLYTKL